MGGKRVYLGLDIGAKRVGVAVGDSIARIAQPVTTLDASTNIAGQLKSQLDELGVTDIVIGRPRNQSGGTTAQTQAVEEFVATVLKGVSRRLHWQDESVTSITAEERLKARKKPYTKADIDAEAATIILQDFLEAL